MKNKLIKKTNQSKFRIYKFKKSEKVRKISFEMNL